MARAACLGIPRPASRGTVSAPRPRGRILSRPSATLGVMLLAAVTGGLCVVGGSDDRDAAVVVAQASIYSPR